jgi:manganese oxidase
MPKVDPSPSPTPAVNFVLNNKSEDFGYRLGPTPALPTYNLFSNALTKGDPKTRVFEANAGDQIRFRVLLPGGSNTNPVFEIHGHSWQEEPYINDSWQLGDNVKSQVLGAQILLANQALNILIDSAGGPGRTPGDYLFYDYLQTRNSRSGAWGILRVKPPSGIR